METNRIGKCNLCGGDVVMDHSHGLGVCQSCGAIENKKSPLNERVIEMKPQKILLQE